LHTLFNPFSAVSRS